MKRPRVPTEVDGGFLELAPGSRLGDWCIVRAIGQGNFARVYEATYEGRDRKRQSRFPSRAALKVFAGQLLISPVVQKALTREAKAMASIDHPNVLRFFADVTLDKRSSYPGTRFFVLELGETDLHEKIALTTAGLPEEEVLRIGRQVAAGICAYHDAQYIHADVKPENVIMVGNIAKLGDAGVAARLAGSGAYPVATTMRYRPPEYGNRPGSHRESAGLNKVRKAYDVWGLGVTLHEALTKRHPYGGFNDEAILVAVRSGPCPPLTTGSPGLRNIIERCLDRAEASRVTASQVELLLQEQAALAALDDTDFFNLRGGGFRFARSRVLPRAAQPTALLTSAPTSAESFGFPFTELLPPATVKREARRGSEWPQTPPGRPSHSVQYRLAASVGIARWRKWWSGGGGRTMVGLVAAFAMLAFAGLFFVDRAATGFYVGISGDDRVAIYDGPPSGLAWVKGRLVEGTDIALDELSTVAQRRVLEGFKAGSTLENARASVARLSPPAPSGHIPAPSSEVAGSASGTTAAGTTAPTSPSVPPSDTPAGGTTTTPSASIEQEAVTAQVEIRGFAICDCFEEFTQVKLHLWVKNTGKRPVPFGAGEGSPWRLLVGPPNHGPFPEPPRTPVPLTYGSLNLAEGEVVSVPPNPPGTITYSDQRDFATRNWPSEGELAPDEEYYVEPIPEARGQRTVYRGSTLVFNVPVDDALTLHGVALVVEGNVVAISRYDSSWPEEAATNDI